ALHQGQPIAHAGAALSRAKAAMILLHGRGASAEDILSLAQAFAQPEIADFAPQAAGHSWYPHSFLAPVADNEPWLSSALQVIADILRDLGRDGIPASRVVLLGFSQGGCLALEFAARNARRYGAVIGLSAGLIGPDGTSRTYSGSLQGTPVFLGCSDVDPHIPLARVHESGRSLRNLAKGTQTNHVSLHLRLRKEKSVMHGHGLVANIVETWREQWNRDKTFLFCVDCAHAKMTRVRTVRLSFNPEHRGASLPSAKCVRRLVVIHSRKQKVFVAGAPRRRSASGPGTRDARCQSGAPHMDFATAIEEIGRSAPSA